MTGDRQVLVERNIESNFGRRLRNLMRRHYLVIGLAPNSVCVMLIKGWGTPRVVEQIEQDVDGPSSWSSCVSALKSVLNSSDWFDLDCRIVLPEQWVRWASLAWEDTVSPYDSVDEVRAQVQSILCNSPDGVDAKTQWFAVPNTSSYGQTQLGAAIPQELLTALTDVLAERGMRMESCQSAHALAWNRWRSYDIDGRQLALHIRASRAQVFCTVDVETLTIAWRYRPSIDLEHGAPDFYKMADRTFDGVRTVPKSSGPVSLVHEIEQQLANLKIKGAVVTVVMLGHKRRGSKLMLINQGAEFWHVIDATNASKIRSGEVLCHLFSPRKKEGVLSWLGLEFRSAQDGVLIDFAQSQKTLLSKWVGNLPVTLTTWFVVFLVVLAGYLHFYQQVNTLLGRSNASPTLQRNSPSVVTDSAEIRAATQVSAKLNWPWARFFEQANLDGHSEISLRGVMLSPNGVLRVSGDSRNLRAAQTFFQSIEAKNSGAVAFSITEQRMSPQNKSYTVHFDVNVSLLSMSDGLIASSCNERSVC